jgi:hypothetical protein
MATGTSAGLLDSSGHAQSVFKHEILRQYMPIFVAMLGSYSDGKRVVVLLKALGSSAVSSPSHGQ